MEKHVQFADESKKVIVSEFNSPQDPDVYDNLGQVKEEDERYIDFKERTKII